MIGRKKFFVLVVIVILIIVGSASFFTYQNFVNQSKEEGENPAPFTSLLNVNGEVNFEVTTENGPANEVCIAVNPINPNNLIAGGKDYTLGPREGLDGFRVWSGYYWSRDGGVTWGNGLMGYPNVEDTILGDYDEISDPVVAFGSDGTAYYSGLAYNYETKFIPGLPRPRIVDNGIYIAKSTDGGETYSRISFVIESPSGQMFHDKQWFCVDPLDSDNVYVTWTMYEGTQGRVVFARSTNGGQTWEPPRDISRHFEGLHQGSGSMPAVGPDGTIYVSWIDFNAGSLMLSSSSDQGLTWPVFAEPIMAVDPLPNQMDGNEYRTPTLPSMAIDRSNADTQGNIYIVWNDYRNGNSDILLTLSSDGGNIWTDPILVNDDPDNSTADQFFPWVAVSPIGDIHIIFYDKRDDPNNYLLNIYYTHSKNGTIFDRNWRITTNSSDPSFSYHQSGDVFIGDYIGIDASESYAYAIWTDTRKGEADAYTAVIVGDMSS